MQCNYQLIQGSKRASPSTNSLSLLKYSRNSPRINTPPLSHKNPKLPKYVPFENNKFLFKLWNSLPTKVSPNPKLKTYLKIFYPKMTNTTTTGPHKSTAPKKCKSNKAACFLNPKKTKKNNSNLSSSKVMVHKLHSFPLNKKGPKLVATVPIKS